MNFEKQQIQFQGFHKEIESLQMQLKEMSRLFTLKEEKIKSDLTELRENFNFEVSEMYTKIREAEDRARSEHDLGKNHSDVLSPGDVKQNGFDNNILIKKTKSISIQDNTNNDSKTLMGSLEHSIDESLEHSCHFIDVMPDMSGEVAGDEVVLETKQQKVFFSNQVGVGNDKNAFKGGNGEQLKVSYKPQLVADHCQSRPSLVKHHEGSTGGIVSGMILAKSESQRRPTLEKYYKKSSRGGIVSGVLFRKAINEENDQDDEQYKSSSFHMFAIGIITDSTRSNRSGWAVTLVSLAFTFLQFVVLTTVVYEASHPTCSSHDECRNGEYCDCTEDWRGASRCEDCYYAPPAADNCTAILANFLDYSHPDYVEVDYTKLAYGVNSHKVSMIEHDCLVQFHCDETNSISDKCDFLKLNRVKWHATQQIVFVFMSLLFATIICSDVQDAVAEETYMNIGLKNSLLGRSKRMAAEILRITLRCRQMILPWYAASSAIAIIINDPLTAQNILLNLLTIEVILIADDMFAVLVLPLLHQDSTNALLKQAAEEHVNISYIWSRYQSITATLVLVMTIFLFDQLIPYFSDQNNNHQTCDGIADLLEIFINITIPLCTCAIHGVVVTIFSNARNMMKKAMLGLGQLLIDMASFTLACVAWTIVLAFTAPKQNDVMTIPILLSYQALYLFGNFVRLYYL